VQKEIREGKNIAAVGRILIVGEMADGSIAAVGSAWADGSAYLIDFVAVSKDHRGSGVGRALMSELVREIRAVAGGRSVYVFGRVHPSNSASLRMMRALDFAREPDLDSRDAQGQAALLFFSKIL
jgi:ribosomal protein S18 acetylase RimI-like enzyme